MTTIAVGDPRPEIQIRPGRAWALDLRELWRFRGLLLTLASRDIKIRYKQTILGVLWVVLQPLMGAGIFTFIFGVVADLPVENDVPYFLVTFAGFQAYFLFSATLNKTANCLLGNAHLITKIYFPRLILPLSSVPTTLLDFGVAMILLAGLLVAWEVVPPVALLLLPLWIVALLALALGIGLVTASLAVHFRDVRYIVPVLVQFATWASPVGYTVTAVAAELADAEKSWMVHLYLLNPLASLLEGLRWSLLGTNPPHLSYTIYSLVVSAVVFGAGALWFSAMERRFADVI